MSPAEFDSCAANYDAQLQQGLAVSGETREFFAERRVLWLAKILRQLGSAPQRVLDYGCGTGTGTFFLHRIFKSDLTLGVDVSNQSVGVARKTWRGQGMSFLSADAHRANAEFDLAFCNGVFHHILPEARPAAFAYIFDCLRPGGFFSFWDNNPWQPATRIVMSRIPFDRNAIMLSSIEAKSILRATGFEVLRTDFLFIFPRILAWMRWFEPWICKLPLGTQYQVLCRKAQSRPGQSPFQK